MLHVTHDAPKLEAIQITIYGQSHSATTQQNGRYGRRTRVLMEAIDLKHRYVVTLRDGRGG